MDKEARLCPSCHEQMTPIFRGSFTRKGKTYRPKKAASFPIWLCPKCSPAEESH
ncbi:hypothetical protein WEV05_002242 [Salmonella enterica]|nr:hypothetical protein [Salmonella enterica]